VNPYPKEEVPDKYWSQRHRFFTLFDKGIKLDKESWYSVTPEAIANHIATHLVGDKEKVVVFDPFCGCGGNAIAFAAQSGVAQVVCIDVDIEKLKKAHHNASIYGVQQKLLLVHGNAYDVLSRYKDGSLIESESTKKHKLPASIDVIFLSPPWGGLDYGTVGKHGFDLTCIKIDGVGGKQFDGEKLLQCAAKALGNKPIAYFLPKNINGVAFSASALKAGYTTPIVMEQNVLNGKLKTVTSYLGLGGE
jgi:trimethylguanosine synthase